MLIPPLALVKQNIPSSVIENIQGELQKQLRALNFAAKIKKDTSVAIVVGSRGIDNLVETVSTLVKAVKESGGRPFIATGMGSHGGATATGQEKVLSSLGITSDTTGAPVHASMETVLLGKTPEGFPVYCDSLAAAADTVILINRIKAHTSFSGDIESGLMKMASIGLGNDVGCRSIHACGLGKAVVPAARLVLQKLPLVLGVAMLENNNGKTCRIQLLASPDIEAEERKLLAMAKNLSPRLPFAKIDLLIVEKMGKNISGTGMDTKVIGRVNRKGVTEDGSDIDKIVVLDLTEESGGNALGMGMADITTRRLVNKIDYNATYENALSTRFLDRAKIPVIMENDREAIMLGVRTLQNTDPETYKIARIKNTLDLNFLSVTRALLQKTESLTSLEVISGFEALNFDAGGNLINSNF